MFSPGTRIGTGNLKILNNKEGVQNFNGVILGSDQGRKIYKRLFNIIWKKLE